MKFKVKLKSLSMSYKRRKLNAYGNHCECECEQQQQSNHDNLSFNNEIKIVIQQLIDCIQTSMLQITEHTSFTAVRLGQINAHLIRLDADLVKLNKEISDLQIHALHGGLGQGYGESEPSPYIHF